MSLNPCGKCGSPAVEQTRGTMGPGDYRDAAHVIKHDDGIVERDMNYHQKVERSSEDDHDMRVACSKCNNATGWDRRDVEAFRRHGDGDNRRYVVTRDGNMENIRKRWNEANPAAA